MQQILDLESILKSENVVHIRCHVSNETLRNIVSSHPVADVVFILQYLILGRLYPSVPNDAHRPTFGYICLNDTLLLTFRHLVPTNCLVFDESGAIIDGYTTVRYKPTDSKMYMCDILKEFNDAKTKRCVPVR